MFSLLDLLKRRSCEWSAYELCFSEYNPNRHALSGEMSKTGLVSECLVPSKKHKRDVV